MISSKEYKSLPGSNQLKAICKAVSVLDAILSKEWSSRYYSYNSKWGEEEECFEMRNGSGDHMLVLFSKGGCVINGVAHEYKQPDKVKLTMGLPAVFNTFIFGEPVASLGTTFCLWNSDSGQWHAGVSEYAEDGSEELLRIFDGQPQTYIDWAEEYFDESYKEGGIPFEVAERIYKGEPLTKAMVLSVVETLEDWEQLKADLDEIGYACEF